MSSHDFEDFHLVNPAHYAGHGYPHPIWTRLRREDPVHWFDRTDGIPFWAITRHQDIVTIGKNPERFVNGPRLIVDHLPEQRSDFPLTLIQLDPPKHGIYRKMVNKRFTPGALRALHGDIEKIAKDIVDSLAADGEEGVCAASDRGHRLDARSPPRGLAPHVRLDESRDRRAGPGLPRGRQDAAGERSSGDGRALHLLHRPRRAEAQGARGRPRVAVRAP